MFLACGQRCMLAVVIYQAEKSPIKPGCMLAARCLVLLDKKCRMGSMQRFAVWFFQVCMKKAKKGTCTRRATIFFSGAIPDHVIPHLMAPESFISLCIRQLHLPILKYIIDIFNVWLEVQFLFIWIVHFSYGVGTFFILVIFFEYMINIFFKCLINMF